MNAAEEQIYECYHVAGLDNIYKYATSRQPVPMEKKYHPLQTAPQQQQQQQPIRKGTKLFHFVRSGAGDKGVSETKALSPAARTVGTVAVSAEQTPMSAAPPKIQAKNQRRRGGGSSSNGIARGNVAGITDRNGDHTRRQRHLRRRQQQPQREVEEKMNDCEVQVEDISCDGVIDGEDGPPPSYGEDAESQRQAAARAGGCWRPIECHQTTIMKSFAFP